MPSYKLTYFEGRGVAEPARLLFAGAGVEYEDCRISAADWPTVKPKMPFGNVPVLEVDGEIIPQSRAIENFLAREFDLYGSDKMETCTIDVICETVREYKLIFNSIFLAREKPEEKKKMVAQLSETESPKLMKNLEKYLKMNRGGSGWFVGNMISYADIIVYAYLEKVVDFLTEDAFNGFPALKANYKKVAANRGIAAWLSTRSFTPY